MAPAPNIAAGLAASELGGFGLNADFWAVVVLAAAIGIALAAYGQRRFAPSAALCWGFVWVAVARLSGNLLSTPPLSLAAIAGYWFLPSRLSRACAAPGYHREHVRSLQSYVETESIPILPRSVSGACSGGRTRE